MSVKPTVNDHFKTIKGEHPMSSAQQTILRTILILLGIANVLVGLNVGLGGIQTLGWQGQQSFFQVTDEQAFLVQDSHTRFFGGLYCATGVFLILATTRLDKYRTALGLVFCLIFAGGLARLSMMRADILLSSGVVGSLVTELLLMPVLYFWLRRTKRSTD